MNGSKNIMNIPEKMKAIKITKPGGAEVLQLHHKRVPKPGYKQILIKICLLYTSPSPRDVEESRMPSSA